VLLSINLAGLVVFWKFHEFCKNPGDEEAAKRFVQVTRAYELLANTQVGLKSYDELAAEMDQTRAALQRVMDLASRSSSEASGKVLKMGGATWVGDVEVGRPHGSGSLILANGAVHAGRFEAGRASGPGVYYDASGSVTMGSWVENKRTGAFETVDPKGGRWADGYDADGKRTSRKKMAPPPEGGAGALKCGVCGVKFHAAHNSACRQHSGKWVDAPTHNADGSKATVDTVAFPEGGLWLCCGGTSKHGGEPCSFGLHRAAEPPPAAPVELQIAASSGGDAQMKAAASGAPMDDLSAAAA